MLILRRCVLHAEDLPCAGQAVDAVDGCRRVGVDGRARAAHDPGGGVALGLRQRRGHECTGHKRQQFFRNDIS